MNKSNLFIIASIVILWVTAIYYIHRQNEIAKLHSEIKTGTVEICSIYQDMLKDLSAMYGDEHLSIIKKEVQDLCNTDK